jgi:hypothetical protein
VHNPDISYQPERVCEAVVFGVGSGVIRVPAVHAENAEFVNGCAFVWIQLTAES